jgi:hypothetical protein
MTNPVGRSGFFVALCRQKVTILINRKTKWLEILNGTYFDMSIIGNMNQKWNLFLKHY